ncbi:MAG: DUF924 domain-containing protein [Gammaproteobacteria bacterium]|nr:MAG: DUF924 domain-containing protein [Gammaproteobacteria bacterium]
MIDPDRIMRFWFAQAGETPAATIERNSFWFGADTVVDQQIWELYADIVTDAGAGHYADWAETAHGRLALIILLDQFPRNIFRGTAEVFRYDIKALELAGQGVTLGQLAGLTVPEQAFFLMPYQHSEDVAIQNAGVALYAAMAEDAPDEWRDIAVGYRDYAAQHRDIIVEYGRFPHRNSVLGRASTANEDGFLAGGGATFGLAG